MNLTIEDVFEKYNPKALKKFRKMEKKREMKNFFRYSNDERILTLKEERYIFRKKMNLFYFASNLFCGTGKYYFRKKD